MNKLNITVVLAIFLSSAICDQTFAAINTNAEKGVLRTLSAQTFGKAN